MISITKIVDFLYVTNIKKLVLPSFLIEIKNYRFYN